MPTIKFTDTSGMIPEIYYPKPGKATMPEWVKHLPPYMDKSFRIMAEDSGIKTNQTAKRCLPMIDAIMTGYTIPIPHDVNIEQTVNGPYYKWSNGAGIEWHPVAQASTHAVAKRGHDIPKLISPWSIETPPGYSVLFLPVINSDQRIVEPFAGVVDTDTYINPVNFPFILKHGFEGTIEAGTPFIQVIPFRREAWTMSVSSGTTDEIERNRYSVSTVFRNAYRKMFWSRKDFS